MSEQLQNLHNQLIISKATAYDYNRLLQIEEQKIIQISQAIEKLQNQQSQELNKPEIEPSEPVDPVLVNENE